METEINQLKINLMELKTDITYIKDALVENKEQHKEISAKIDHLGDTFQGKIQDKADQKEVMNKFKSIDEKYVSQEMFSPIQKLCYGMAGAILLGFVYALVTIVFK